MLTQRREEKRVGKRGSTQERKRETERECTHAGERETERQRVASWCGSQHTHSILIKFAVLHGRGL